MIIMKLDYIFAPLYIISHLLIKAKNFIFSTFLGHTCWINSSSFKKKIKKKKKKKKKILMIILKINVT